MESKKFMMPELGYNYEALEPLISREAVELHYAKHLQGYVDNLNKFVVGSEFENRDLDSIVREADGVIFNNGAQVWNHNFFFESLSRCGKEGPTRELGALVDATYGSFEAFQAKFEMMGATLFGSGWVWLSMDLDGNLVISQEANAGNPLRLGHKPLLVVDVWEHAYYVDYRNRRVDYLKKMWELIDWHVVEERFESK